MHLISSFPVMPLPDSKTRNPIKLNVTLPCVLSNAMYSNCVSKLALKIKSTTKCFNSIGTDPPAMVGHTSIYNMEVIPVASIVLLCFFFSVFFFFFFFYFVL